MASWPYNSAAWKSLRRAKLAANPLCEMCLETGMVKAANTVDHRKAISDGGDPFPPLDELASLCAPHHSMKTARGPEAGAIKTDRAMQPRKGCDVNGNPIDRSHPWAT